MRGNSVSNILSKLTSPIAVKAALAECDRLGRDLFLAEYGFKPSAEYVLHGDGAEYDSKAIAAVAFGYQFGTRPLSPDECRGGKDRGNAGWALDRLGFRVSGIKHVGWWLEEVEPSVDAYFEMFALYRAGRQFKKSDYLKRLHEKNPARSYKAYEFKLQNVSAVLNDLEKEWLPGYAPKAAYQHLLRYVVEDRLGRDDDRTGLEFLAAAPKEHAPRLAKIDWAKRDAENRELGNGGERYVFEQERLRLIAADKPELAARVTWNARDADGHGYDITSFDADGGSIHIEVKTTTRGEGTPFFVSDNELRVSQRLGDSYRLYRVFNFPSSPQVAVYGGPLSECLKLSPASYRAQRKVL
jgi:hypothetical protein